MSFQCASAKLRYDDIEVTDFSSHVILRLFSRLPPKWIEQILEIHQRNVLILRDFALCLYISTVFSPGLQLSDKLYERNALLKTLFPRRGMERSAPYWCQGASHGTLQCTLVNTGAEKQPVVLFSSPPMTARYNTAEATAAQWQQHTRLTTRYVDDVFWPINLCHVILQAVKEFHEWAPSDILYLLILQTLYFFQM